MSLINPKNFLTPITNVWHLATIAVVALLFGVYRMAGGGINVESIKTPKVGYIGEEKYQEEERLPVKKAAPAAKKSAQIKDPFLDDLIAPDKTGEEEEPSGNNDSPLDDIAKQLGVE